MRQLTAEPWDAEVIDEGGRTLAAFRCTQLMLYPKAAVAA